MIIELMLVLVVVGSIVVGLGVFADDVAVIVLAGLVATLAVLAMFTNADLWRKDRQ